MQARQPGHLLEPRFLAEWLDRGMLVEVAHEAIEELNRTAAAPRENGLGE